MQPEIPPRTRRAPTWWRLLPALGLLALLAPAGRAGMSYEDSQTPEQLLCDAPRVVVARVEKSDGGPHTKGKPPRVRVVVEQTLGGEAPPVQSETWTLLWRPGFHGVDWGGAEAEARIRTWEAEPYPAPAPGSRWILVFPTSGEGGFGPKYRHPATDATLAWARRAIACEGVDEDSDEDPDDEDYAADWELMVEQATGSLQRCPDEWIQNRMPGIAPEPGTVGLGSSARDYFVLDGRRREIAEFDGNWIDENCQFRPTRVE